MRFPTTPKILKRLNGAWTPEQLAQLLAGRSDTLLFLKSQPNQTHPMNYTPEQFAQAVLKALETLNTPDVSKLSIQERKDLARNPNTPPEILTILARDKDWGVRCGVAENPNTPPKTLTILARDKYWNVRCRVALNPNTPTETLTILARDEDWNVRQSAQQNPNYNPVKELKVTAKQYEALKSLLAASKDEDLKSIQF